MLKKYSLILIAVLMFAACEDETVNETVDLDCEILGTLYENNSASLDLRGKNLAVLPDCIGNLTNLTYLRLTNNQLTTLPESIGDLTSLTYLRLTNNQLTTLPESIGNLTNLVTLDLSKNKLTTLPESIGNLTNLEYLYLFGNNFYFSDADKAKIQSWLPNCYIIW
ncbi:MAG: leucine-rich repeat domain-containing protein [Candidatus Kapabacteria bacterium]|jgi:Leucine-rich repeat (LRR) protein|nr:leucine-rich repeat domain-containing protein [Candidatus Kapabacteria bacterium]